jgi:hypothetical protein
MDSRSFASFQHALLVEQIDLGTVEFLCLVALDFHGVCQDTFGQEWLCLEVDVFDLLEACKTSLLANCVKVDDEFSTHCLVSAELFVTTSNVLLCCEFLHELLVRNCNGNDK